MKSSLLIVSFFLALLRAANGQSNETAPQPIIAEFEKPAVLPCNHQLNENQTLLSLVWRFGTVNIVTMGNKLKKFQKDYKGEAQLDDTSYALTLLNAQFADAGTYICTVTTFDGSSSHEQVLEVLAVPSVTTEVFPFSESVGTSTQKKKLAECKATGGSEPFTMRWETKPQQDLVVGNNFRTNSVNPSNNNLVDAVLPLTLVPDAARNNGRTFSCVVIDAFGNQIVKAATLKVSASLEVTSFPTNDGSIITMEVGETRDFICAVTGVPSPDVTWFKGSTKISEGHLSSMLTIDEVTYDDSGTYTCQGENGDSSVRRSFTLDVKGIPVITNSDNTNNNTENVEVKPETEVFSLSCEASSLPLAEFTWKVEGLNESEVIIDQMETSSSIITISSVNISSNKFLGETIRVTCVAFNKLGSSRKDFVVTGHEVKVSSTGLVVGVVIAIIVIVALVFFIVYFTLSCRRRQQADLTTESSAESGCCTCLSGICSSKKTTTDNSDQTPEGEPTKEVREEGTKEEKQKLTEAEQQPAEKEKESTSSDDGSQKETEAPKSKKSIIPFPSQCCRGSKKELKEQDDAEEEEAGIPPTEENKGKDVKATDSDSGKGDTLEKVIEEPAK